MKVDLEQLRQTYEELKKVLRFLEIKTDQINDVYRNLQIHTKGLETDIIEIGKIISAMKEQRYKLIELMVGIEKIHNCYQTNEKKLTDSFDESIRFQQNFATGYIDVQPISGILNRLMENRR